MQKLPGKIKSLLQSVGQLWRSQSCTELMLSVEKKVGAVVFEERVTLKSVGLCVACVVYKYIVFSSTDSSSKGSCLGQFFDVEFEARTHHVAITRPFRNKSSPIVVNQIVFSVKDSLVAVADVPIGK